jgi:hypothetical protein
MPALFPSMLDSLRTGGYVYLETFGDQGENYRDLPRSGEIRAALGDHVDLKYYREKAAGPKRDNAVSVKALARNK